MTPSDRPPVRLATPEDHRIDLAAVAPALRRWERFVPQTALDWRLHNDFMMDLARRVGPAACRRALDAEGGLCHAARSFRKAVEALGEATRERDGALAQAREQAAKCRALDRLLEARDDALAAQRQDLDEIARLLGCGRAHEGVARCVRDALRERDELRAQAAALRNDLAEVRRIALELDGEVNS